MSAGFNPDRPLGDLAATRNVPLHDTQQSNSQISDAQRFDAMVRREAPQITRLVGRLVAWGPDAEDLVQEVFVRAWTKRATFRGDAQHSTWLQSIAVNVCRNYHRRRNLWRRVFPYLASKQEATTDSGPDQVGAREQVWSAIESLRPVDREIIVLRAMEERSPEEAARILGISVNAADVRYHRARGRIREIMEQADE